MLVGVLSDSHGTLDPRAVEVFTGAGVAHLIHAGDVGSPEVIVELECIAPLTVVRGNTDPAFLGIALPDSATVILGGVRFAVAHEPLAMSHWALPDDVRVAITGHTHRPAIANVGARLHVNPGSVFRPRGPEGRTVALIAIDPASGSIDARIVPLEGV